MAPPTVINCVPGVTGKHPAPGNQQLLDIAQEHAGFALEHARFIIERDEVVEPLGCPQHAVRVEADVAVAAAVAVGQARLFGDSRTTLSCLQVARRYAEARPAGPRMKPLP